MIIMRALKVMPATWPASIVCRMDEGIHLSMARFNVVCVDLVPTRRLIESPSA